MRTASFRFLARRPAPADPLRTISSPSASHSPLYPFVFSRPRLRVPSNQGLAPRNVNKASTLAPIVLPDRKGWARFIGHSPVHCIDNNRHRAADDRSRRGCASSGKRTLRQRATFRKPAIITRRISTLVVRSVIIAVDGVRGCLRLPGRGDIAGGSLRPIYVRNRRCVTVRRSLRRDRHSHFAHPADESRAARFRAAS